MVAGCWSPVAGCWGQRKRKREPAAAGKGGLAARRFIAAANLWAGVGVGGVVVADGTRLELAPSSASGGRRAAATSANKGGGGGGCGATMIDWRPARRDRRTLLSSAHKTTTTTKVASRRRRPVAAICRTGRMLDGRQSAGDDSSSVWALLGPVAEPVALPLQRQTSSSRVAVLCFCLNELCQHCVRKK